ncbi:hypothetical protein PTE_02042 [Photorhabdus khanii NC19]|uniref:Uncharacterized protein n=1 Tax=Photorhabdus khanii NC19 TaxID=1004151 RepID=W3VA70_9GAMM|nr:hypothetical protein [Photorhabdus khanii]ETS31944.1 hypothetical protein PTE_02042 [Photorhabdus khanii NC19]
MKKCLFLLTCLILSFSCHAAQLPAFDTVKKNLEAYGLLKASEWKFIGDTKKNTHVAIVDGNQYWANNRAIAAVFKLTGNEKVLEKKLMDTAVLCVQFSKSVIENLTEEQGKELLATMAAATRVEGRQVSTSVNSFRYYTSIDKGTSDIVFTCGISQGDFS